MLIPMPPSTPVLFAGLALHLTRLPTTLPVPASRRLVEEELVLVLSLVEQRTMGFRVFLVKNIGFRVKYIRM